jgi:hypothetical protein
MTTRRKASTTTKRRRFSIYSDSDDDDDDNDAAYGMTTRKKKPQPKKAKTKTRSKPASRRSVLEDEISTCSSADNSDPECMMMMPTTTTAKKAAFPASRSLQVEDDSDDDDDSVDTAELVRRIRAGTQNNRINITSFPTTLPQQERPLSMPSPVVSPRKNYYSLIPSPKSISMIVKKPLPKADAAIYDPAIGSNDDDDDNDSVDTPEITRRLKTASGKSLLFQTTTTNQMTLQQEETPLSIPSPVTYISPPKQQPIVAKEPLSKADAAIYDPTIIGSRIMEDDDEIDSVDTLELTQRLKARYPPNTITTSIAATMNSQPKIPQTIAAHASSKPPPKYDATIPEIAFVLPPPSDSSSSSDSEEDDSESDDNQQETTVTPSAPTIIHPTTRSGSSCHANMNMNMNARTTTLHCSAVVPSVARMPSNPLDTTMTTTTSTNTNHHQVPLTTTTNPHQSRSMMAPIPATKRPLASNNQKSLQQSTINPYQKKSLVQTTLNPFQKKITQTVPSPLTERPNNSRQQDGWNPSNHNNNDRQDQAPKSLHLSRPWSEEELLEEAFLGPPSPEQESPPAPHTHASRNPSLQQNHSRMPEISNPSRLHSREQQQQQQHLTTEQLFEQAFFSPPSRKPPPPQPVTHHQQETRVPQSEEELFQATFDIEDLPRQQQQTFQHDDLVDLSLDASDDEVQPTFARMPAPVHVHEGLRTEPKAPRFNIAARAFLTSPHLQPSRLQVPPLGGLAGQDDGSDIIEEFPDDSTTRRRLFTTSTARRVTEDHSHNIRQHQQQQQTNHSSRRISEDHGHNMRHQQQQQTNHSTTMSHDPPSARAAVAVASYHQPAKSISTANSTCNLPRPWEASTTTARRRRLRDATANPSNARSIVAKRTTSVAAPRQQQHPATNTTSLQQASADLWFRQPPTNTSTATTHSNVGTIRNDLQGGSGVGAGGYSLQSSQRQQQDQVDDEVSASTTTKSRGKARSKKASTTTSRKRSKSTTTAAGGAKKKRGGWGGKRRGKKKGGARGGASNFKRGGNRGAAGSSGEGVWGSETVTWQPPPSNSRQDSTLQHVGGAEITF